VLCGAETLSVIKTRCTNFLMACHSYFLLQLLTYFWFIAANLIVVGIANH